MKRAFLIFAALMLLLTPVMASADFVGFETSQCWDTWNQKQVGGTVITADVPFNNIYGQPQISANNPAFISGATVTQGVITFPTSGSTITPIFEAKIPNADNNNPFKYISVDVYYFGSRTEWRFIDDMYATAALGYVVNRTAFETTEIAQNQWYTHAEFTIERNPALESIFFVLGGTCNWQVEKICIDTVCVPTPIPGSVLLMGTGILGLVGVGIRRKL